MLRFQAVQPAPVPTATPKNAPRGPQPETESPASAAPDNWFLSPEDVREMTVCDQRASADATMSLPAVPSLGEATRTWLKIGCLGFGGPAGQIALMHRVVVDEKKWIDEPRFLHALNYCMLLPGPEAQQLATYLGWLLHGIRGGVIAGTLFVVPGALVLMALSISYALYSSVPVIAGLFWGIKAAVLAVVVEAVLRIGRRALRNRTMYALAASAFAAIFFAAVPFPLIILAAAILGYVGAGFRPDLFASGGHGKDAATPAAAMAASQARPTLTGRLATFVVWSTLWFAPILLCVLVLGGSSTFVDIGVFFSKMAVVTFGGAYAVLSYVAQQAVSTYGWLAPGEMLTGLGLAETTPGPLILVLQFVAFVGAFRNPGPFAPLTAGILGSLLALWVTFVPCFLWIFLGAPYVERLRGNVRLAGALSAITAAVVGVILNLAMWFALHVIFADVDERWFGAVRLFVPDLASIDGAALLVATGAMLAMLRFRVGMLPTLAGAALAGVLLHL